MKSVRCNNILVINTLVIRKTNVKFDDNLPMNISATDNRDMECANDATMSPADDSSPNDIMVIRGDTCLLSAPARGPEIMGKK